MSSEETTQVILSYGMGVESTAILLRWMLEPETCPCELSDLLVITSQVGNEFRDTGTAVEKYILPLMRERGIRFVQVARHGHLEADGITVLDDSRNPERVYLDGDYKLSDELTANGTVPQFAGVHRCALKFKAFVIERWLSENLRGGGDGRMVQHAIGYNAEETGRIENSEYAFESRRACTMRVAFGFNAEETGRIETANEYDGLRSAKLIPAERIAFGYNAEETSRIETNCEYNMVTRIAFYPLLEWGWNRERCIDYIFEKLGVAWRKSCCVFCPFACNRQNMEELGARHREHPEQVADAMAMEHMSLALNPRGTLYRDASLIQITINQGNAAAVESYEQKLNQSHWALYRVRRIYQAQKDKAGKRNPAKKGTVNRAVEKLEVFVGKDAAQSHLRSLAGSVRGQIEESRGISYLYRERCGGEFPAREEFYTVAPSVVETKARYGIEWFDNQWLAQQATLF